MLYEQYDHDSCLTDVFHGAVSDNRNIVLQTGSLFNARKDFAESVIKSLSSRPRILECRFLYDRHGSELYEKITELPEYYPTRTEAAILEQCAAQISRITGPCTLLELGSGSSTKTDLLLSAYSNEHGPFCYAPIDVSESVLRMAGREITAKHPHIKVVGIHGTYHDAFPLFRRASPALVIFLGSTIGNFTLQETDLFWRDVIGHLQENDYFLLGIDLIK